MMQNTHQKISVSLSPELLHYAEEYQKAHNLASRSEVIAHAMKALRERELLEGYQAMAQDYRKKPDPFVEAGIHDGLEPSDETSW
ncbi:MAG: ribbon-helix-helix domain-containing protein [Trueperaceae bacterium]